MRLENYLEQSGESALALREKIGASRSAFSRYVIGVRTPPLACALRIVRATRGRVRLIDLLPKGAQRGEASR